ncbi:hypothetical protein ACFP1L_07270 [Lactiplantibacillus nangangensis]|uniref:LPXTG cell wall anchor domain-containing protein n=1 Tax=Lactiplantibacillus nangangensis TaxID=2559917 RepID=A0ABW1SJG0_9LACO|nr:hypothetical protein [Lactiplantibacillus nangangensis]
MKTLLSLNPVLEESIMIWLAVSTGLTAVIFGVVWLWKRRK